jgi:hypothetical protein
MLYKWKLNKKDFVKVLICVYEHKFISLHAFYLHCVSLMNFNQNLNYVSCIFIFSPATSKFDYKMYTSHFLTTAVWLKFLGYTCPSNNRSTSYKIKKKITQLSRGTSEVTTTLPKWHHVCLYKFINKSRHYL